MATGPLKKRSSLGQNLQCPCRAPSARDIAFLSASRLCRLDRQSYAREPLRHTVWVATLRSEVSETGHREYAAIERYVDIGEGEEDKLVTTFRWPAGLEGSEVSVVGELPGSSNKDGAFNEH